jgi:hypothetical protein
MAEKVLNRMRQDCVRAQIQVSSIINRLEQLVAGEIEMTATQVNAARILLDKAMSNAPVLKELSGVDGEDIKHSVTVRFVGG